MTNMHKLFRKTIKLCSEVFSKIYKYVKLTAFILLKVFHLYFILSVSFIYLFIFVVVFLFIYSNLIKKPCTIFFKWKWIFSPNIWNFSSNSIINLSHWHTELLFNLCQMYFLPFRQLFWALLFLKTRCFFFLRVWRKV